MSGIDKIRGDTRSYGPEDFPKDEAEGDVRKVVSPSEMEAANVEKHDRQNTLDDKKKEKQKPGHFPDFMEEDGKKKKKKKEPLSPEMQTLMKLEDEYLEARFAMEKQKQQFRDEMGHGTTGTILQRLEEQFVLAEKEFHKKRKKVLDYLKKVSHQEGSHE